MTTRKDSAPLTPDDSAIWCEVYLRSSRRLVTLVGSACRADRRDADLMYWAQGMRQTGVRTYLTATNIGGIWCGVAWYYKVDNYVFVGGGI